MEKKYIKYVKYENYLQIKCYICKKNMLNIENKKNIALPFIFKFFRSQNL